MTMREVVKQLQSQGHVVSFYVRKDGGILIRSLDGINYQGAKGNTIARQMVGSTISEARISQLKYATRARKFRKPTLDDEVKKEYDRVKKKWNKAFKAKQGKHHPAGYFGWNRINRALREGGKEEALKRIREAEKYATGFAYSKNVKHLYDYIIDANKKIKSPELEQLAEDLMESAYTIREEWILPAYDALYELNHGIPPQEVVRKVRAILRLYHEG